MPETTHSILKFSVSHWEHLYSLQQAIDKAEQASGKRLEIQGQIRNENLLNQQDTPVFIRFYQVDDTPQYTHNEKGQIVLGTMLRNREGLHCQLPVDHRVFEEMRRNMMEYADIDGIHIVVSIGLELDGDSWPMEQTADIVSLDYAMRGDA